MQQLMHPPTVPRQVLEIMGEQIVISSLRNRSEDIPRTIRQVEVVEVIMLLPRQFQSMESCLQLTMFHPGIVKQEPPQTLQLYPRID